RRKSLVVFDARELADAISKDILESRKKMKFTPVRSGADYDVSDVYYHLSSGTSAVDSAIGGGLGCGRIVEICGDPSTGKSLILEASIIAAQRRGGIGVVIDSEATFNKPRFTAAGGDVNQVLFIEAPTLEDGFFFIKKTILKLKSIDALKD